jgi:hypothetical protein
MSLINDALKRAQESQRKDSPAYIVSPMRPNAPAPAPMSRRKQRNLSWFMPVVIVLLVLVAAFFMAMAMAKRTVKTIVVAPAISPPQPVETVAAPAPDPPAPAAAATAASEPPPGVIGPAAIIVANVPKPVIILQGVVNDPKHPWAIVNGKTVYLGDNVEGMRVTVISRSSITLTSNGQTNIVYVGQ